MKTLIQFKAPWCGPCRMIAPLIQDYEDKYSVVVVDIDENPDVANKYKIRAIPTVVIKNGEEEIARLIGKEVTKQNLDKYV